MFSKFSSGRMTTKLVLLVIGLFTIMAVGPVLAISSEKPVFTNIEVKEIAPPHDFQNARRYLISYFAQNENSYQQVFPTLEEKKRDYDLILARVVRKYLEDEYYNGNKAMDEHVVENSNKSELFNLVGKNYLSKAWNSKNLNVLRQYILRNKDYLQLYTLNVYLDYGLPDGGYNSGNDINPILLKFNKNHSGADEATFIMVNYSDK